MIHWDFLQELLGILDDCLPVPLADEARSAIRRPRYDAMQWFAETYASLLAPLLEQLASNHHALSPGHILSVREFCESWRNSLDGDISVRWPKLCTLSNI